MLRGVKETNTVPETLRAEAVSNQRHLSVPPHKATALTHRPVSKVTSSLGKGNSKNQIYGIYPTGGMKRRWIFSIKKKTTTRL